MKNWKLIAAFAAALTGTAMPAHAEIDLSANFGIMSDYIYRGFHQSDGVANGGIDLASGPFYLGTWIADLDSGNGIEIDVYGGLAFEFDNGFSAYIGYTAYRYTEDDDGVYTPAKPAVYSYNYTRTVKKNRTGVRRQINCPIDGGTGNPDCSGLTETVSVSDVEGGVYKWAPKDDEGNSLLDAEENPRQESGVAIAGSEIHTAASEAVRRYLIADSSTTANDKALYVFTDEEIETLKAVAAADSRIPIEGFERVVDSNEETNRWTKEAFDALSASQQQGYDQDEASKEVDTEAVAASCDETGFDKDYDEINVGVGYAKDDFSVSLDYSIGEHENFCGAEDNDYDIATLTLDYKGAYVTFGTYGISEDDVAKGEPEGDYVELGYATTINEIDFAVYLVDSDEDIDDETRLGMSVSYGFGL